MAEEKKQSLDDVQREIAEVELETKRLQLAQAKQALANHEENERRRRAANKRRMDELQQANEQHEATVRACRHRSGGTPKNILKGGGRYSFSLITRALMPDGVTILLQCSRCRMNKYPPQPSLKKKDPKQYMAELKEYNALLEESRENGLEHAEMRGPTFMFQNADGVPIIPERV